MTKRPVFQFFLFALAMLLLHGCGNNGKSDAYGNFESTEILISAEGNGNLMRFDIEEGKKLQAGAVVGYIDTVQLSLKRRELAMRRQSLSAQISSVLSEIAVLEEEKSISEKERERYERLVTDKAVPTKQLDDINDKIAVTEKRIRATETQNANILGQVRAMDAQIAQLDDQIRRCVIRNPIDGVVLTKYAEPHELTAVGKPLYKIADLNTMFLRVYVSGDMLPKVKIGQKVEVLIDKTDTENQALAGEVSWISDKVEFTPKIIQTKDERVSMVYAVKIKLQNDGSLKIGMPGEANFK
ncbi:putative ABC transport system, lipoprotein [Chloroherpeton thalassium ATCC 35110]|uniref:Putative ABC transport system, lipoprotein n=1 Tax=Chloroherpeton thalassium (strain ATCC 35110 / GB-78) TaxID=517418 RepID=B3QZ87_CHLT3|nr:HlyD family efflux transporter periplasmic adaptor subunit [Chloroherpeton thalassium]ACF13780.1 putative ABC transport system, lipoprotein [Chloroherpeton thalassium ATCC 35110]